MRPAPPPAAGAAGHVLAVLVLGMLATPVRAAMTVTLAMGAGPDTVTLSRAWSHRAVDVGLVLDMTGSMTGELSALRAGFSTAAASLQASYPDLRVGVAEFEDWPCGAYGSATFGDAPFRLVQRCTSDLPQAQSAINTLSIRFGGDEPEAGYEAIHQAVTGVGVTSDSCGSVAAFDPSEDRVAGVADGDGGGMGFRDGLATRVLVVSTDADFHESTDYAFAGPASRAATLAALQASDARFVGILSSSPTNAAAQAQLRELCATASTITPLAHGTYVMLCETGINGTGTSPVDGACPNVFLLASNGSGITTAMNSGVRNALDASPFTLATSFAGAALPVGGTSADFVQESAFTGGANPAFAPAPTISGDGATLLGSFASGTADLRLVLENLTVASADTEQYFPLVVEMRANGVVVTRDTIVIEVPRPLAVPPAGAAVTLRLSPASRNPSSDRSGLRLVMPAAGAVTLTVCDAAGRRVRTLASGERPAGTHVFEWDGTRDDGSRAPAGLYFVRAACGDQRTSLRITRLR